MATIKDIAKKSGYGMGTVSRALNGESGVSEKALKNILETAEKMGYSPNTYARNLAKRDFISSTVGLLMLMDSNMYLFELLRGIYSVLNRMGYNILLFSAGKHRSQIISRISSENLCSLLVIATGLEETEKLTFLKKKLPFVYLDHYEPGENSLSVDNIRGGRYAAEYLVSKGCKKIAYVGETRLSQQQNDRFMGFSDELEKREITLFKNIYVSVTENLSYSDIEKRSFQTAEKLIREGVDGIFCYCDELAFGVLQATRNSGRSICVVGYDDIPAAKHFGLTTIHQPLNRIGEEGAKAVISLSEKSTEKVNAVFRPKLIIRQT